MLTKELLEIYKAKNPKKYEEKLRRGEFDAILGKPLIDSSVNPLIVKPPKEDASNKQRSRKYTRTKKVKEEETNEADNRHRYQRGKKKGSENPKKEN